MDIAFITPEITPYSRATEVGDLCAALPKALRGTGHRVTVISPLWADIDPGARSLARRLNVIETRLLIDAPEAASHLVYDGRTTGGVDLVFIAQAERFGHATSAGLAGQSARERVLAGLDFAIAAVDLLCQRDPKPDIVHAHGYLAAAALPLVRERLPNSATVLSVHDLEERGALEPSALQNVRLPDAIAEAAGARPSLLRAGLSAASRIIAGSHAEARALASELPELEGKLLSISAGVDSSRINPASDALIPARFDAANLDGKRRCKDALQYAAGLPLAPTVPVLLVAGDMSARAAAPLVEALPAILRNEVQVIIFGADAALRESLAELGARYAERLKLLEASDERALHAALAGADFVLLPNRSPLLGDLHLSALRYGALPVAVRDARVRETLVDCDAGLTTGNALLCEPSELLPATQRALAAYATEGFEALCKRAMRTDASWERAARRYEFVYKALKG